MSPITRLGPARAAVMAVTVLALALLSIVAVPRPAEGAGAPAIEFVSPGGLVSSTYHLNVSITGEVDPASVKWGFGGTATFPMDHGSGDHFTSDISLGAVREGAQTVTVEARNLTGTPATASQSITVDNTPPEIEVLSKGGYVCGAYAVVARVSDTNLAEDHVTLSVDSQVLTMDKAGASTDLYRLSLDTTALADGQHAIVVRAEDTANALYTGLSPNTNSSSPLTIYVDNTPPQVQVTFSTPTFVRGVYTVNATVSDMYINASHVWVVLDGNASAPFPMTLSGGVWRASIDTAKDLKCGPHTIKVEAADLAGQVTQSAPATLRVDNCPPMFTFTSMGGHVMGVYNVTVRVEDAYPGPAPVYAIFDSGTLDKVAMTKGEDGTYYYRIDTSTMSNGDHTVQSTTVDLAGYTGLSAPFVLKVDNAMPVLSGIVPGGDVSGEWLFYGMARDAYLNTSCVHAAITNASGGMSGMEMMTWTGSRFEVLIDTTKYADGCYNVSFHACDEWGMENMSAPVTINVDNNPPCVKIMSTAGTVWGNYKLQVQVVEANLNKSYVRVKVGSADPVPLAYNGNNKYWERTIDTKTLPDAEVALTVIAMDLRGNVNATERVTIRVENRADLVITKVELDSKEVAPGATVKARVTVRNQGHVVAKGFDIVVMTGARTLASTTEAVGINPSSDKSYVLQWKASGSGTQPLRAMVDTGSAVPEIQEGNNAATEVPLKVTGKSPGSGTVALVAALAVGALALRRRRS